jgi:ubiquinone/menaquinone biosynthesis C-methylase UbiE
MSDLLASAGDHYGTAGLTARLRAVLQDRPCSPRQLAALDQFHTRGLAATADLARMAGIGRGMSVLDVGCGLGGPARFLAETFGCRVAGIDLSEAFIAAADYLTERTGQRGQVSFQIASALALPFAGDSFEVALLQHVAMNIAHRDVLYREIRRVLKRGGKFATFDIVAQDGEPHYPVPWARSAATSFLFTADQTGAAIAAAGFRPLVWQDDSEAAKAWFVQSRLSGPPPEPNLALVMGEDFFHLVGNLGRNLLEGRLGVISAVFEAVDEPGHP